MDLFFIKNSLNSLMFYWIAQKIIIFDLIKKDKYIFGFSLKLQLCPIMFPIIAIKQ